jgi:uncharacterized metal-binding protein
MSDCTCDCNSKNKSTIFSCSGASDFGEISDKLARKLNDEGLGNMSCIAGIGASGKSFIGDTTDTRSIFVIDGCGSQCGKKCLEKNGLIVKNHIVVSDFKKSDTNNTDVFNSAYHICEGILHK